MSVSGVSLNIPGGAGYSLRETCPLHVMLPPPVNVTAPILLLVKAGGGGPDLLCRHA